jgi:hypothetical protein
MQRKYFSLAIIHKKDRQYKERPQQRYLKKKEGKNYNKYGKTARSRQKG